MSNPNDRTLSLKFSTVLWASAIVLAGIAIVHIVAHGFQSLCGVCNIGAVILYFAALGTVAALVLGCCVLISNGHTFEIPLPWKRASKSPKVRVIRE